MSWQRPTLNIDLSRSYGAYAYDLTTQRHVLDLFGMFSSMPLGYEAPSLAQYVLGDFGKWVGEVIQHSGVKFALGAVDCPAAQRFRGTFARLAHTQHHPHHFFTNTGSQAVEAALKACFEECAYGAKSQYVAISRSFHGVYGYAASAADVLCCDEEPWSRVRDLPTICNCMVLGQPPAGELEHWLAVYAELLVRHPVAAVLVEPIQCTAGDIVLDVDFLRGLRRICTDTGTPLVFDEIQTGFGVTGAFWYYEKLGIVPDVVVFGKKAQVSGFMSNFEFDARKLASTWQGDVIDMIRCTHVLEEYERAQIVEGVEDGGGAIDMALTMAGLDVRRCGLLIAVDFDSTYARDEWCRRMWDVGVLVNPTGERCVRLRPPLNIDDATISDLASRLKKADEDASKRAVFAGFAP